MALKQPIGFKEQVQKLVSHGIFVEDEQKVEKILRCINYYRLTGYALQFRKSPKDSDCVDGTTFEQIFRIYQFDVELRDALRKYLEKAEVYYKTQIACLFSCRKCGEPPYDQHYDENSFFNKKGFQEVLDNFKKEKNYYRDSLIVKHHKEKYMGKMPLWVIVELLSFSNVSKLYNCMYYSEKDEIAASVGVSKGTLENHLHCLSVLRNKCAHGARLYNTAFNPPAHLTNSFLRKNPEVKNDTLFAYILILLKRLPDQESRNSLYNDLEQVISKYEDDISMELIGFPEDYVRILKNNL